MEEIGPILITKEDLIRMGIAYSNTHMLSLERIGAFPSRVRLSPQKVAWNYNEVMDWVNERSSQRAVSK